MFGEGDSEGRRWASGGEGLGAGGVGWGCVCLLAKVGCARSSQEDCIMQTFTMLGSGMGGRSKKVSSKEESLYMPGETLVKESTVALLVTVEMVDSGEV